MSARRILIVGGGIGGLALAYWLKHHGFEPVIADKATAFSRQGFLIAIKPTGTEVLDRMGLTQALAPHRIPLRGSRWIDKNGKTLKTLHFDRLKLYDRFLAINRADLHDVLLHHVQPDVDIRLGTHVTRIEQANDHVQVTFHGGSREAFDLLIGADGFHSGIRTLVFGPGHHRFMNAACFAFLIDNRLGSTTADLSRIEDLRAPGHFASCGRFSSSRDAIGGYFVYRTERYQDIPPAERKRVLEERFARYSPLYRAAIDSIEPDDLIYHDEITQIEMPTWHRHRVALIGDAAYCMTIMSAMGASAALAGAYILAQQLARTPDHARAFLDYEHLLRQRVAELQRYGRRLSAFITGKSRTTYELANLLLRLTPEQVLTRQLVSSRNDIDLDRRIERQ